MSSVGSPGHAGGNPPRDAAPARSSTAHPCSGRNCMAWCLEHVTWTKRTRDPGMANVCQKSERERKKNLLITKMDTTGKQQERVL